MGARRGLWLLAAGSLAIVLAFGSRSAPYEAQISEAPATLDEVAGTDLWRITLTESAATRLDIQTETVEVAGDGLVVPSAAVIITPDGSYWVYTNPQGLTYLRHEITDVVEEDHQAFFSEGPSAGTAVVVTGVPELYGAEFGIGK